MKFAAALIATVAAQAPDCSTTDECVEQRGEGACCAQLLAATTVEGGNYGGFGQYIWKLADGETMVDGTTATLCVP